MQDKTPTQDVQIRSALRLTRPLVLALALGGCQTMIPDSASTPSEPVISKAVQEQKKPEVKVKKEVAVQISKKKPVPKLVPPPPPEDLVEVIRGGLGMNLDQDNARIRAELRWYSRNQGYFNRVIDRATPYLHYIVAETKKRNMPMEMALLPIVESAFDPFAYSFGRAAGLWQFIPSTGRHYGLEQNWWYDGRRDVVAATNAALDYLVELNEQFDDWELALAAYNGGRGNVANSIKRNKKKGKATDFWSLSLHKETSAYVPKLIAIGKIFRDPARYNLKLKPVPNEPFFAQVDIGQQIDLARAAKLAELEMEELYRLNPAFNRWATSPDGPHRLLIPVDQAESFREAIAGLPFEQRLEWQRYTIKSGDSLIRIAKRFGTSPELIKDVNRISGTRIVADKSLLIPVPSGDNTDYTLTAEQRRIAKASRPVKGRSKIDYIVRSGDSFWEIARKYDVSVKSLASWNSMAPGDTLRVGQKLVVWTGKAKGSNQGVVRKVTYKVRSGDNLSAIASRFRVSVNDIRNWNTLGKYLQPGDNLTLFVDVTAR
ncbi:LysM peptidoglycan-binding domain-containing protein [Sansalvadorimonas sp. 2012CJ34-2]|uniref:LysM peptidoglycan-binding domain-containing protein n=1 Tax=Parendozoicomonas callyspongiae TaxID=2942213 RepID=A0ABT0PEM7_9GAMM|nr:LysM peptidoglycan-binding domain-containing protein [Sansalvadorimonas sp. 2012CJ34-2]MCL6269837.1 LysM peptidoglycan-binding domain-containing protein [Sansalvadorimonas sp. 2012CJ34-2]